MTKAQYLLNRVVTFINSGVMEEEYWHMKLETSRMIEIKNLCNY
ncbi:hypothetical protein Gogos_008576 [Gossypium gossypioides]|uniref:Uncharacterized protein n=1 Tax=Gossypium gossypioides TaxID=34282 RepID=A0A7J9CCB6_GOSGO|nr:hypothetical protein [Gossypium gossypioides]